MNQKEFFGHDKDEVLKLALEFKATLDKVQQPILYGPNEANCYMGRSGWFAIVTYWGTE